VVTYASFRRYVGSAVRGRQQATLYGMAHVEAAITAYQQASGTLPKTLGDIPDLAAHVDDEGQPVDHWRRPLHYRVEGTRHRLVSYGRDGKPGGVGLDYDLSNADLPREAEIRWPRVLPRQSAPTFRQFLTDRGGNASGGSGGMMALMSLLSGATAFALAFQVLRGAAKDSRRSVSLFSELLATVVITLIGGVAIAWFHLPTGH